MFSNSQETTMYPESLRVMCIGVGPHAQRIYLPALHRRRCGAKGGSIELVVGVDIKSKESEIESIKSKAWWAQDFRFEIHYIERFDPNKRNLPTEVEQQLDQWRETYNINAIIIATEPLVHVVYGLWAVDRNLPILMDKPISTRVNAALEMSSAEGIFRDYKRLSLASGSGSNPSAIFSINVQRRFHYGFQEVLKLIREVRDIFGQPITSFNSSHGDGQWRLPNELKSVNYHGYGEGYGKISHSGYHFIDVLTLFIGESLPPQKTIDSLSVVSSVIRPDGYMLQQTVDDLLKNFANAKNSSELTKIRQTVCGSDKDDHKSEDEYKWHGEVDANIQIECRCGGVSVATGTVELIHNSFSRRSDPRLAEDLYKGNGRVKHESHCLRQGHYQTIYIRSFQSEANHDKAECSGMYDEGGDCHFEIVVYRNSEMFPDPNSVKAIEKFRIDQLVPSSEHCSSDPMKLPVESAKYRVVDEFIDAIRGKLPRENMKSAFASHAHGVHLMSAIYQSTVLRLKKKNPVVEIPFDLSSSDTSDQNVDEGTIALCKGMLKGGCSYWTNFPGFKSQDIFDTLTILSGQDCGAIALNEKIAFEMAYGSSLAGRRAAVTFKNYGLNVGADPYLNSLLTGVHAGLVLVITDDIEVSGSQGLQDSRHYYKFNGGLWLEPNSLEEAYNFGQIAFKLSEEYNVPVVIRLTNSFFRLQGPYRRVEVSGMDHCEKPRHDCMVHNPKKFVNHPVSWKELYRLLSEKNRHIQQFVDEMYPEPRDFEARLAIYIGAWPESANISGKQQSQIIKVSTLPIPQWIAKVCKTLAMQGSIAVHEHGSDVVTEILERQLTAVKLSRSHPPGHVIPNHDSSIITWDKLSNLFVAIKRITQKHFPGRFHCIGDLGQYTSETTNTVSSCLCLGSAVSVCLGMAEAGVDFPLCVTGDAALVHAGGESLLKEVESRGAQLGIVVIDNGGSVSTGGQMPALGLDLLQEATTDLVYEETNLETFVAYFDFVVHARKLAILRVVV